MKGKFCCFVLITFALSLSCVNSRPLTSNQQPLHKNLSTNKGNMSIEGHRQVKEAEEMKMIGSSPPSCEHKCYGCMPCEAIQVPTNTGRVGVQYTNYEPEGWKCKCGPAFYTP